MALHRKTPRIHINSPYEDENITVHFIGDDFFDNYRELKYHTNPGFEICLISYGKGVFKIEENAYPIGVGQIFMTKAPQVHAGWPSRENPYRIQYICFHIKEGPSSQNTVWSTIERGLDRVVFPVTHDRFRMAEIHQRLIEEVQKQKPYSEEMVCSLVKQFILLTLRNFEPEKEMGPDSGGNEGIHEGLAARVMNYLSEHLHEEVTLDTISRFFNYSVSYLCRRFKEQTGFSVMEYYNFARLERAKKYLLMSDEPVSQIAEIFGYSSVHHFSNAFKTLYGYSPVQCRKTNNIL